MMVAPLLKSFLVIIATLNLLAASPRGDGQKARSAFKEGLSYLEKGDLSLAKERFHDAALLAPDWALAHLNLGIAAHSLAPGSEEASKSFTLATKLAPKNPRAHYYLALTLEATGQEDAAAREFKTTLKLREHFRDAQFRLAALMAQKGDALAATQGYESVLKEKPEHTGALTALAALYEANERKDDAEKALLTITHYQPGVAYHHYQLARFYDRVGDKTKARKAYKRAEKIDPRPKRQMRRLK
ncbi:tetratricopeptide repeat protein [Myxococcota bacterium]|nr:tetratricopeptide repeat protein [Myxococcota bacterium]